MVEIHKLSGEEFSLLGEIADGFTPDPASSMAILAKEGGEIVGRVFLLAPVHVEGPWVREDRRGSTIVARLMERVETEALRCGVTKLFAYGASPKLEEYLSRIGYVKQPLTVWAKDLT